MSLNKIIDKLTEHDQRFDMIKRRLDYHDKRFDDHDRRFEKLENDIASLKDEMLQRLDWLIGAFRRLDEERLVTNHRLNRLEKRVFNGEELKD